MATTFTSTTLSSVYNDDFNQNDHYHQILFNSGRALQARELTQLQTLIYQELGRFGRNIFKEGAAVSSGGLSINSNYDFVQIGSVISGGDFADIPVGSIFVQQPEDIRARVLAVAPIDVANGITVNTLFVQYISSGDNAAAVVGTDYKTFDPSGDLSQIGGDYELTVAALATAPATSVTGKGVRIDVGAGDFFVMGRFVHASAQSLLLSPYGESVDAIVGFKVVQEIVTVNDTSALYDNAGGLVNTASPGADRYRILLQFVNQEDTTTDDTFVFVARIENSKIVEEVDTNDGYNKINDLLALRTKEESGDYIVSPFTLEFDSADAENLSVTVSSGLAYVNGYRVENPSPIKLTVPRSQATEAVNNEPIPVIYGNYVELDNAKILPDLTYGVQNIYTSISGTTSIGTCRVRGVDFSGGGLRAFIFDVQLNAGADFSTAQSIGTNTTQRLYITNPTGNNAQILGTTDNDLLFPTPRPRSESMTDIILIRQESFTGAADGSGKLDLAPLTNGVYIDDNLWILCRTSTATDAIVGPANVTGIGTDTVSITGLTAGASYTVLYYMQVDTPVIASKTSATITGETVYVSQPGTYDLGVPDVYQIDTVKDSVNGIDVSERFILDDGQRDNFYDTSKLLLLAGQDSVNQAGAGAGSLYVSYKKYTHTGVGDFFAPSSYDVPYSQIPTHTLKDGTEVSLRNYLDFRPDKNGNSFSNIFYLPRRGTSITADVTYYLPRADKLIVTQEGDFQILMGQQSRDPQLKKTPDNSMELYQILMGANTANEDDVQIRAIEHKHYTMADIAKLENKLDDLREYTELNIAELRAYHTPSLDSDGIPRAEAGMVVEENYDQTTADTENEDYAASLDPENNLIRPRLDEDNIRMIFENTLSNNVTKKGDNVYLDYTETTWKEQTLASRSVKVNPFSSTNNIGTIKLSPSSDEFKDSKEDAVKVIKGSGKLDVKQAFLWNNWQWNWKGRSDEDQWKYPSPRATAAGYATRKRLQRFVDQGDIYSSQRLARGDAGFVRRVVKNDTLRSRIGNKTVDVALVPWMRSRKIYFHAKGLKPNTKFTPFFDGQDVSVWCRQESTFVQWSDRTDDVGNQYTQNTLTEHPDGSTSLVADANGEVIGSFWIPNLKPEYHLAKIGKRKEIKTSFPRFRAGVREFKLLDISVNDWNQASSKAFTYYTVRGALWNRWLNHITTRGLQYSFPLGFGFGGFTSAYTPKELKASLDAISAAGVGIEQPQLAGQYGPDTTFLNSTDLANLDASGDMSKVLSDYINVDNNQFAGSSITTYASKQNPLAQTFYVDNQFGVVLTKVSLFFKDKPTDDNMPVSIHLRPVVNGKPSDNEIVPDSHVFLNPNQVTTIPGSPTLSVVAASPTHFEFEEPVFLQPWTEYAIVITSQSTEYEVWSAKTQDNVLGSTARRITTQPAPGSLFLPQNGVTWTESKDQDLMMTISRAQFDIGGGSVVLRNVPMPAKLLGKNPIRLTEGSGKVYVKAMCHGLAPNDTVVIDSCGDIANISANTSLNSITHTIDSADIHGFTFTMPGGVTADRNVSGGGVNVLTQRNFVFDVANPNLETIVPNFTSIDVSAKFLTGIHISGTASDRFKPNGESGSMANAKYQRITLDQNIEFDEPRAIYHSGVTDVASGLGGVNVASAYSAYLKVDLKSSNDYVSPVIDLQRASLTLAGECIDDPVAAPQIYPVAETSPSGGSTGSKHITTPVITEVPATGLDIRATCNLPPNSAIDFYYRTASADEDINQKEWIYKEPVTSAPSTGSNEFAEVQWLPGGKGGTLPPFQQSQTKFVARGKGKGPGLKGYVAKYMAV